MKYLSLVEADSLYKKCSDLKITWHPVKHDGFERFYRLLGKFMQLLGDEAKDDYWRSIVRLLRRFRFETCAAPLPFNHPFIYTVQLNQLLNKALIDSQHTYPNFTKPLQELITFIKALADTEANPIMNALEEIISEKRHYESTTLLLKEARLIPLVENLIQKKPILKHLSLINAQQAKGGNCFARIFIIGQIHWFPEYLLTAPRASKIDVVCYSWVMNRLTPPPVFTTLFEEDDNRSLANDGMLTSQEIMGIESILPELDWDVLLSSHSILVASNTIEPEQETADAHLILLDGDVTVFLDESSSVLIIDLDEEEGDNEDEETQVKRILAKEIRAGIYILLRTSGGGEYIKPLADKILSTQAVKAREAVQSWKNRLREAVNSRGLHVVIRELDVLGCLKANDVNVRNWMSARSIKPRSYEDFKAIMKLVNLEDKTKETWNFACAIDDAHKKAGFHIRKLLLKQVLSSDLTELQKIGKMNFELDEEDGGTLTAFRVINRSPEKYTVPLSRIGQPCEIGGNCIG